VAGARSLYDVSTEAALFQPCIMLDPRLQDAAWPAPPGALALPAALRCASLASAGVLAPGTPVQQATEAYERLRASGWDEGALALSPTNVMFDLWRSVGATYAAAYAPHGYRCDALRFCIRGARCGRNASRDTGCRARPLVVGQRRRRRRAPAS
jgi:hydroxybutyrate-dimer hydrolase